MTPTAAVAPPLGAPEPSAGVLFPSLATWRLPIGAHPRVARSAPQVPAAPAKGPGAPTPGLLLSLLAPTVPSTVLSADVAMTIASATAIAAALPTVSPAPAASRPGPARTAAAHHTPAPGPPPSPPPGHTAAGAGSAGPGSASGGWAAVLATLLAFGAAMTLIVYRVPAVGWRSLALASLQERPG